MIEGIFKEKEIIAEEHIKEYFKKITETVERQIKIAEKAKAKGLDASLKPETMPTSDLAERTESLVGPKGIAKRFRELIEENNGNRTKTIFQIAKEIVEEKWCTFKNNEEKIGQAIRTGLMIETEAVVVSPLDGLPEIKISKNFDGSQYLNVYYAGPIRAAGGSGTFLPLVLGDYLRKIMNLDVFKPTDDEVERYVEEMKISQAELQSRQITITNEEVRVIAKNCPVCINGVPTVDREVETYRNLPRFPNNRIRGGVYLVITEGVLLKAMQIMKLAKEFGLDWNWLEKIVKVERKAEKVTRIKPDSKYLERIAAGRPLLAYPSRFGGFRIRFGKARNNACMAKCINTATMYVLDEFIAVGTHTKVERPGKAAELFPCNSIDGPTVLLSTGEVLRVNSEEKALQVRPLIKEILFLGDILVTVGDFVKTAHPLVPSGFVEEWWVLELKKAIQEKGLRGLEKERIEEVIKKPLEISGEEAVEISERLGIPLHAKHLHYYTALKKEGLEKLVKAGRESKKEIEKGRLEKAVFALEPEVKKIMEDIGLPHKLENNKIIVEKEFAFSFLKTIGAFNNSTIPEISENVLEFLSKISGIEIKDKAGTFIGCRMGRPEAARPREMRGKPHALFPIGFAGGSTRSIAKAAALNEEGTVVEIGLFKCSECSEISPFPYCKKCSKRTRKIGVCMECGREESKEKCRHCGSKVLQAKEFKINLGNILENAFTNLKIKVQDVKGVKGLINSSKIAEPIEKGILRAKHGLHVFRDGTIRYEALNAPLTHFKPCEIGLSVEKVKELGYKKDFEGNEINLPEQLIELFPQDIIIFEGAGEWLVKVSQFVDDLLEKFYKVEKIHNVKTKEDLIGEIVLGLAPHTSVGVVARIIGYSKTRLAWGHPYWGHAKRRNYDGDQDSIMLLSDALLNFSNNYLSEGRGGRMDAPLVFTVIVNPEEVDFEIYKAETVKEYPLELYYESQVFGNANIEKIKKVSDKIGKEEQYSGFHFTHEVETFDKGPERSRYVTLETMEKKLLRQAKLQNKIRAVDKKDALERVLVSHFLPDIIGNARSFSRQNFRCTKCNSIFRRIPLVGKCTKCGGNIILTIAQGSVRKYLEIAKNLVRDYQLSEYLKQRLELIEREIDSIFKDDKQEQKSLFEFV